MHACFYDTYVCWYNTRNTSEHVHACASCAEQRELWTCVCAMRCGFAVSVIWSLDWLVRFAPRPSQHKMWRHSRWNHAETTGLQSQQKTKLWKTASREDSPKKCCRYYGKQLPTAPNICCRNHLKTSRRFFKMPGWTLSSLRRRKREL